MEYPPPSDCAASRLSECIVVIEAAARQKTVAAITMNELFLTEPMFPVFPCADIFLNIRNEPPLKNCFKHPKMYCLSLP